MQIKRKYTNHHVALNTAAHVAAANDQLEVLRMLADNNFDFKAGEDLKNSEGKGQLIKATHLCIWLVRSLICR